MISPTKSIQTSDFSKWQRMLRYVKPYRGRFAAGIALGMLTGGSIAVVAEGLSRVLKVVFEGENTSPEMAMLTIFLFPTILIVRAFLEYLSAYCMNWVGTRVITDLRQAVFAHTQKLSLDFYTQSNVGDLISRFTNDCQQAQSAVTSVIADAIKHPFAVVTTTIYLVYNYTLLSTAAVVLAPFCIFPIVYFGRRVRKISKLAQENQGEILSRLHETITGARVVKAFTMEEEETKKFREVSNRQFSFQMKIIRFTNILSPLIEVVAAVGGGIALYLAYRNGIPMSDFMAMLVATFLMYAPIKGLSKLHLTIQKSMAATDRVLAILDLEPTVKESPESMTLKPIKYQIQFERVSFRYGETDVLNQIELTIPHGKTVALVGPSGSGKTTLLNLLPRFYDPREGRVLIDGIDVKNATLHSLRGQMAIVTQDTILFNDTIRNNIRYGSLSSSENELIEAARRANAHDFIMHQAQGYDTLVGDKGVKLSGGQKQRIAIARALLKNPPILLLDEATSALDTESERLVQEALDTLVKGRTVIAIAHRLSTIQKSDLIVVLDRGAILEMGTHDELLRRNRLYRKLYDMQFQEPTH
jgi:ATP-binding cassette, subfamily B, bacterial MsbA